MKEKIILIGGGGHCKSCIDGNTLEEDSCIDQPNNPINQTDDDRKTDNKRPDPKHQTPSAKGVEGKKLSFSVISASRTIPLKTGEWV